jgi:peptidoglycan/xylan/chitin deacetylase (PgdA/CDA1 family)
VVTAREFAHSLPARAACFTFDDAYLSTMQNAPSILEEFKVRGSFYAVPGLVGKSSEWDGDLARPLADWSMLLAAQARGHEVGNHTLDHPHLARLPRAEQLRQVRLADEALRREGLEPGSFCYPYGSLCDGSVLAECGYRVGLALGKAVATERDDLLRLPRVVVAYSDSVPMLLYRVHVRPLMRRP